MENLERVVQAVRNSRAWDFTTQAGLCGYSRAVITALHAADPAWGYLTKSEGQNHCDLAPGVFVAVDAALYRPTGQVLDFIGSAGFGTPPPANPVAWQIGPVGEYPADRWLEPGAALPGPVDPPGDPMPPADLDRALLVQIAAGFEQLAATVEADHQRMEAINTRFDNESRHFDDRLKTVEARPPASAPPPIVIKKPTWWPF